MFSIEEAIKYGWNKTKENMELVLFATLLIMAVGALISGAGGAGDKGSGDFAFLSFIATIFVIIVKIGYNKIFLRIHDGENPKFGDIFKEYRTFWKFIGVSILYPIAVLCGIILLIIPGIFWAIKFSFSPLIVIDTKIGPIKAMKESYAITRGAFWKIMLFWIAAALLNFVGILFFGIGLLLTMPVTTFATVYVYRLLSQKKAGLMQTTSPQAA